MPTPFEDFVNAELPKRISTKADPLATLPGLLPITTGVGLEVELKDPSILESLKGPKGDPGTDGKPGAMGTGLNILGTLKDLSQLDSTIIDEYGDGDTWVINGHFYTKNNGAWEDFGDLTGPAGKSAFEVAKENDPTLTDINSWLATLRGADGIGLRVLGSFNSTSDLPQLAENGDCYIIGEKMHVWDGTHWVTVGQVGPAGKDIYELATERGFVGTKSEYLASLVGKSAYKSALSTGFVGTESEWVASIKGDKGDKGDIGPIGPIGRGIAIIGSAVSPEGLPAENNTDGDTYEIATHLWSWYNGAWHDSGSFTGSQGIQGVKGDKGDKGDTGDAGEPGASIKVLGSVADTEALAAIVVPTLGDSYVIGTNLYTWNGGAWADAGPFQGPKGIQGDKGDKGDKGDIGGSIRVLGSFNTSDELLTVPSPTTGDAYVVGLNIFAWNDVAWVDVGQFQGPKGEQGVRGIQGEKGDKGDLGRGLVPKGSLAKVADLATLVSVTDGDTYLIEGHFHSYDGTTWVDYGYVQGPAGPSAFEVAAKVNPTLLTEADFIASLEGPQGDIGPEGPRGLSLKVLGSLVSAAELPAPTGNALNDAYLVDGHLYLHDGVAWVDMGNLRGDIGPQGDIGPGVTIAGKLNSVSELPSTGSYGEGYLIDTDFWGWTGAGYDNLGPVRGPKGERGATGPTGATGAGGTQGPKGDKGDAGARWIVATRDPDVLDGRINDCYFNSVSQEIFFKISGTAWASQGKVGGGNVYDAPYDSELYVRRDGTWVKNAVNEAPSDGKEYVRASSAWKLSTKADGLSAGSVGEYLMTTAGWNRFNRYDLETEANASGALDLGARQVFNIAMAGNLTITLNNAPAEDRSMAVIIVFNGSAGTVTWPISIKWADNTAPMLGNTFTVVVLLWSMGQWIGTTSASA